MAENEDPNKALLPEGGEPAAAPELSAEDLEAEKDFQAAFGAPGDDPPPAPTETDAKGEPPPAEGDPPVVEAKPPPTTEEKLAQYEKRIRKVESRVGEKLTAEVRKAIKQATDEARKAGVDAPTPEQIAAAKGDAEAEAKLRREWPEWGAMLDRAVATFEAKLPTVASVRDELAREDYLERQANPWFKDWFTGLDEEAQALAGTAAGMKSLTRQFDGHMARVQARHEIVENAHTGWMRTIAAPEFNTWLATQPDTVKALADSDAPRDAIQLLDAYAARAETPPRTGAEGERGTSQRRRLESAVTPTQSGASGRKTTPNDEEDFLNAFNGR